MATTFLCSLSFFSFAIVCEDIIIELMGVYADGSVDIVIFFSQTDAHFRAFHITADIDDIAYPARRKKLPQELLSVLLNLLSS